MVFGVWCWQDGVYVNTRGPRFETKAEVRHFTTIGDVVGMTAAHEAGLAKELGLRYAAVCIVDNVCNGLEAPHETPLSLHGFHDAQARNLDTTERIITAVATALAQPSRGFVSAAVGHAVVSSAPVDCTHVDLLVHAR